MARIKQLFDIAKDNGKLLNDLLNTLKVATNSDATASQVTDFKNLVEKVRREIIQSQMEPAADENGAPAPAARKEMAEKSLKVIREAKKVQGLSEGDIALLDAREA